MMTALQRLYDAESLVDASLLGGVYLDAVCELRSFVQAFTDLYATELLVDAC